MNPPASPYRSAPDVSPPRSASSPRYSFPPHLVAAVGIAWLLRRRRSFRHDAQTCLRRLSPPLRLLGEAYIPQHGPCVITFNHYHRPGFNALWIALAIAAVVPVEMHFVMTEEWTFPGRWYAPLGQIASHIVLRRAARMYDFSTMPPMPPRPQDVERRAQAVLRVLNRVRRNPDLVLGLSAEGGDSPDGTLMAPPPGAGRFALLLAAAGLHFVPAGIFEAEGTLCLQFGPAYDLRLSQHLPPEERDALAARIVMEHIAAQLPEALRGEFSPYPRVP